MIRQIAFLCLVIITAISCSKKASEEKTTKVSFKLPEYVARSGDVIQRTTPTRTTVWAAGSVTAVSDFECYAVAVNYLDAANKGKCFEITTTGYPAVNLFNAAIIKGALSAGSSLDMDVPTGPARTFYLLGFKRASGHLECPDFSQIKSSDYAKYLKPYLLSQVTRDLGGGTVDVVMTRTISEVQRFSGCADGPFGWEEGPPATAPTISIYPVSYTINAGAGIDGAITITINDNGQGKSCTVNPALPSGISLDPTTCEISGTAPAIASAATDYTITVTSGGLTAEATLTLTVIGRPVVTYPFTDYVAYLTQPIFIEGVIDHGGAAGPLNSCVTENSNGVGGPTPASDTDCKLTGAPTTAGTLTFDVKATNSEDIDQDPVTSLSFNYISPPTSYYLYAIVNSGENIQVCKLNYATGALSCDGGSTSVTTQGSPTKMAYDIVVHPSGKYLYVAANAQTDINVIQAFKINPVDGSLSEIGSVGQSTLLKKIVITPDGRFVFARGSDGNIYRVNIDMANGGFSGSLYYTNKNITHITDDINHSFGFTVSKTGHALYSLCDISSSIKICSWPIGNDGSLGTQVVSTAAGGRFLEIDPTNSYIHNYHSSYAKYRGANLHNAEVDGELGGGLSLSGMSCSSADDCTRSFIPEVGKKLYFVYGNYLRHTTLGFNGSPVADGGAISVAGGVFTDVTGTPDGRHIFIADDGNDKIHSRKSNDLGNPNSDVPANGVSKMALVKAQSSSLQVVGADGDVYQYHLARSATPADNGLATAFARPIVDYSLSSLGIASQLLDVGFNSNNERFLFLLGSEKIGRVDRSLETNMLTSTNFIDAQSMSVSSRSAISSKRGDFIYVCHNNGASSYVEKYFVNSAGVFQNSNNWSLDSLFIGQSDIFLDRYMYMAGTGANKIRQYPIINGANSTPTSNDGDLVNGSSLDVDVAGGAPVDVKYNKWLKELLVLLKGTNSLGRYNIAFEYFDSLSSVGAGLTVPSNTRKLIVNPFLPCIYVLNNDDLSTTPPQSSISIFTIDAAASTIDAEAPVNLAGLLTDIALDSTGSLLYVLNSTLEQVTAYDATINAGDCSLTFKPQTPQKTPPNPKSIFISPY